MDIFAELIESYKGPAVEWDQRFDGASEAGEAVGGGAGEAVGGGAAEVDCKGIELKNASCGGGESDDMQECHTAVNKYNEIGIFHSRKTEQGNSNAGLELQSR